MSAQTDLKSTSVGKYYLISVCRENAKFKKMDFYTFVNILYIKLFLRHFIS